MASPDRQSTNTSSVAAPSSALVTSRRFIQNVQSRKSKARQLPFLLSASTFSFEVGVRACVNDVTIRSEYLAAPEPTSEA